MASGDELVGARHAIPAATFVENVDEYMKKSNVSKPDALIKMFDENLNKYRFMESNLQQKKRRLKAQVPEISKSLELLKHLEKKSEDSEPLETRFMLSEGVYAQGSVAPTKTVGVWLGANVMVEYPLADAQALLGRNLAQAQRNLEHVKEDIAFIRDQCTTTEVNMARVFNWNVQKRRQQSS